MVMNNECPNISIKAFLMLIVSGCIVGLGPVIAKSIAVPAATIVLYRIALPIPMLYFLKKIKSSATRSPEEQSWRDNILMMIIGLFFALDLAAFYISLKYISVASATLLSNLSPVFLTSYAIIRKGRITKEIGWALIAIVGLIFLCGTKNNYSPDDIVGYLTAVSAAGFFTFYILLINKLGKKYGSTDIMFWSSIGASIFLLLACIVCNFDMRIPALDSFLLILLLSFGVQLVGQTMLTKAISIFPPAFSSLGILIDPVAAAVLAWLLLHEALSIFEMIGIILVLIGIFGSYQLQKNKNDELNNEEVVYAKS